MDGGGAESVVMVPVQRKGAGWGEEEEVRQREERNREERSEGCRDSVGLEWSQSVSRWQSEEPLLKETKKQNCTKSHSLGVFFLTQKIFRQSTKFQNRRKQLFYPQGAEIFFSNRAETER